MSLRRHWPFFTLVCILIASATPLLAHPRARRVFAQEEVTREDRIRFFAPTFSGQTGLFETVAVDTLRAGEWSFGLYYVDSDLSAAEARDLAPPSARPYQDMGYDLYRLSASIGVGLTDRWEVTAMLPWDRIAGNGGDRVGFINGVRYDGEFTDSAMGAVHLATKLRVSADDAATGLALSAFINLATGDEESGVATGASDFGVGLHAQRGMLSAGARYMSRGNRELGGAAGTIEMPEELHLEAGINVPLSALPTTNWISEINTIWHHDGDHVPDAPLFLQTGFRHWMGATGWALNAGARWNVAKFGDDKEHCELTEMDDCGLSGLIGLTFAPRHIAAPPPPPPPPPAPVPPPPRAPEPVPPPVEPVAPPHQPQELRSDEIHFDPGSARLTNIAKAILDEVALRMKQEPSATGLVIGYTDDREQASADPGLDRRRAEAVRDYLTSRHGIDASRITVEGRGAAEPVGDNTTAEGRLRNRRVVIRLILP